MAIDPTIDLGHILTIAVIGGGLLKSHFDRDRKIDERHKENQNRMGSIDGSIARLETTIDDSIPKLTAGVRDCREKLIKVAGSLQAHVDQDHIMHENFEKRFNRLER